METLETILSPIIGLMEFLLGVFYGLFGSYGLAIIALSIVVRFAMIPVARLGKRYEEKEIQIQLRMAPAIKEIRSKYSGQERFEQIELIYGNNHYHPIHSMISVLPLFIQIPFLLSALFLLINHPDLVGHRFAILPDLSNPDQLLRLDFASPGLALNLLPLLLTGIAIADSLIKKGATLQSRTRFLIVALVLLILIYPLPASVCLYWLTSNLWSLVASAADRESSGQFDGLK